MRYLRAAARFIAAFVRGLAYAGVGLSVLAVLVLVVAPRLLKARSTTVLGDRIRYLKAVARLTAGLARGLAYAGLCLSLLVVLAVVLAPRVTGVQFATVLSDSMEPSMTRGDMIVTRPVDGADIEVGDVILFRSLADPRATVAHRVVEIVDGGGNPAFVTKGDANEVADRWPVPASRVLGKVQFNIPLLGYVTHEMRQPLVFLLVLAVPGSLIIATEAWNIVRELRRRKEGTELADG